MVFSRFFKDKRSADAPADSSPANAAPEDDAPNGADADDIPPEEWQEHSLVERAEKVLPTGTSTGSKRVAALYGDADVAIPPGPTHFSRASGCHLELADGTTIVDCTMALGAVSIGYADPVITRAVMEAAGGGNVAGLAHEIEVEVAERFCEYVPCADKVQFLKTGAEAVAAAIRLARAHTGRSVIVGSGYFGWHDWCSDAPGVPAGVRGDYRSVPFDDIQALERAVADAGTSLAAIIIEPVVNRLPSAEWVARARALADERGALLILDEIKTGFRLATGGYQEVAGVTPDLATFGKALANGYPLAAVCGRADVMDAARSTWISSTLATEATALAAALNVLEMHRERGAAICEQLAATGTEMQRVIGLAIESSGLEGVSLGGLPAMWYFDFHSPRAEALFLRHAVASGVLFKRGAYNFPSLAHDDDAIIAIEAAASTALVETRESLERE